MEGGVGILLLVIIAVVAVGIGIALYVTGGAILGGGDREKKRRNEPRPDHKVVENPEKVEFVGTDRKD
jgi:hypothetical protein